MKSNAFHWYQSLTIQNQTITINSDFQPKSTRITISFKLIFDLRKPKIRCEIDLIAKGIGAFTWDAFRKRRDSWLGPWWMELREKVGQIRLVDSDSPSWIRNEDLRDFLDLRKKGERECVSLSLSLSLRFKALFVNRWLYECVRSCFVFIFPCVKERNEN